METISVRTMPIRSAKKPTSLEPIKLPMPKVKRMTLILLSIIGMMKARKGVIYVSTTEKLINTKNVTPRVIAIPGSLRMQVTRLEGWKLRLSEPESPVQRWTSLRPDVRKEPASQLCNKR